jgi:hypothetical protein
MVVQSLVEDFIAHRCNDGDRESPERLYPALFDHYYRYWCPRDREASSLPDDELRARARLVLGVLEPIGEHLASHGLDFTNLRIVLFVGRNTSNGHAFADGDAWVVWLPVETYGTQALARVFVTHEIMHALHYRTTPAFDFADALSKTHLGRQLITEGLATHLTARVLGISDGEALWADYLSPAPLDNWLRECKARRAEMKALCLARFNQSVTDLGLFMANDPNDVMNFRAGYHLGAEVIRGIASRRGFELKDLLALARPGFESLVIDELKG